MTLLTTLISWLRPVPPPSAAVRTAIAHACDLVDPMLKGAPGLEKTLAAPVQSALNYCEQLVAGMQATVAVDRAAFASDPLVHALFATADDIAQILGRNQTIRDYLQAPRSGESEFIYAMLAARRHTKKTTGVAMEGNLVRGDVPMEYLFFADHTLAEPAPTEAAMLAALRGVAFDSLLKSFRSHLMAMRDERQKLRDDRDAERDQLAVLRSQPETPAFEEHTRRLEDLEKRLRETAETLQPEQVIDALATFLHSPEAALRLEPVRITVDRNGIVQDEAEAGKPGIDTLDFQQIIGRDRRRYLVRLVRFNRVDAIEGVAAVKDQQSRYLII